MKKTGILSAIMLMLFAVSFTSCETEPVDPELLNSFTGDNGNDNDNDPAVFKVDFNGETFNTSSAQAAMANGFITISAVNPQSGEAFNIAVQGTTVGTYDFAVMVYMPDMDVEDEGYANINPDGEMGETDGMLVITSIDTENQTISGTFEFTGWWPNPDDNIDSIEFTNGSFENVPYTGINVPIPGGDEYFRATIDGQDTDFSAGIGVINAGGIVSISGMDFQSGTTIQLGMNQNILPGSYNLSDDVTDDNVLGIVSQNMESYIATGGTMTIASNENGWIEGTFEFFAENYEGETVTVTEGEFNVELP